MDEDKQEIARHLYAVIAKILEDATEIAEPSTLDTQACVQRAKTLRDMADQIDALARAAMVIGKLK